MSIRHTTKKYLFHIWEATLSIGRFTEGLDAETFGSNELIQAAVERKFEVIGETLLVANISFAGVGSPRPG